MKKPVTIEFVNHASVLIGDGETSILSDPWYSGSVFHYGWSLLTETSEEYIEDLLRRTTYIWVSHEHPDHFSPAFFLKFRSLIQTLGIEILFQETRDRRVVDFFEAKDFKVLELKNNQTFKASSNCALTIAKSDLYDSALLVNMGGEKIFNLNDCPIHLKGELAAFVERFGTCDVLLTQFSYAAWKGGAQNKAWRSRAAQAKLKTLLRQAQYLKPTTVIPFASFIYFSNEMNAYMNDEVNTPARVAGYMQKSPTDIVFLRPHETQYVKTLRQDPKTIDWWETQFSQIDSLPKTKFETQISFLQLENNFSAYRSKIFLKNSKWIMVFASKFLSMRPFGKTVVRLLDLSQTIEMSIFEGLKVVDDPADLEMHSSSLNFIFMHEFGFDTLFVNGCFEESIEGGFERFAKCFAVGNLNSMGIYINLKLAFKLDTIKLLLNKLISIRKNVKKV